jgi:hypothetical protein
MSSLAFYGTGNDKTIPVIVIAATQAGVISYLFFTVDDYINQSAAYPTNPTVSFQLPSEEVQMWKDITVNAIIIYLKADITTPEYALLLIQPSLDSLTQNMVLYTSQSVNVFNGVNGVFRFDPATMPLCDKYPQLTITFTCPVQAITLALRIYKISMFCSYDSTQVP